MSYIHELIHLLTFASANIIYMRVSKYSAVPKAI